MLDRKHVHVDFPMKILFRFSDTLIEAKQIAIKKGLYLGLCQWVSQIAIYLSFAMTFWCKKLNKSIHIPEYLHLDGPYLVRTECDDYDAGAVIVVC